MSSLLAINQKPATSLDHKHKAASVHPDREAAGEAGDAKRAASRQKKAFTKWANIWFSIGAYQEPFKGGLQVKKRMRMNRSKSRRQFKQSTGVHPTNSRNPMRGGIRL